MEGRTKRRRGICREWRSERMAAAGRIDVSVARHGGEIGELQAEQGVHKFEATVNAAMSCEAVSTERPCVCFLL